MNACTVCGKAAASEAEPLKHCANCRGIAYCSAACQKQDWPTHKKACVEDGMVQMFEAIRTKDLETIQSMATSRRHIRGRMDYQPPHRERPRILKKWTVLHHCVYHENADALKIILEGGQANVDLRDGDKETALFLAATCDTTDCLKLLLEHGASPDAVAEDGFSALMMATRDLKTDHVALLMEYGVDPGVGSDMFGRGALQLASYMAAGMVALPGNLTREQASARAQQLNDDLMIYDAQFE